MTDLTLLEIAAGISGHPTPVDHRGLCWFCGGGLGHPDDGSGHKPRCAWVHRDDLVDAVHALDSANEEIQRLQAGAYQHGYDRAQELVRDKHADLARRLAAAEQRVLQLEEENETRFHRLLDAEQQAAGLADTVSLLALASPKDRKGWLLARETVAPETNDDQWRQRIGAIVLAAYRRTALAEPGGEG